MFQWLVQIELWTLPDHSLWKAASILHHFAPCLAVAFEEAEGLERVLAQLLAGFRQIAHQNRRRAAPTTTQRLAELTV